MNNSKILRFSQNFSRDHLIEGAMLDTLSIHCLLFAEPSWDNPFSNNFFNCAFSGDFIFRPDLTIPTEGEFLNLIAERDRSFFSQIALYFALFACSIFLQSSFLQRLIFWKTLAD